MDSCEEEDDDLESGDIGGSYYQQNKESKESYNLMNDDVVSNNPHTSVSRGAHKPVQFVAESTDLLNISKANKSYDQSSSSQGHKNSNTSIQIDYDEEEEDDDHDQNRDENTHTA